MAEEDATPGRDTAEDAGDSKKSGWQELLSTEDYWAIWLGLLLIAAALAIFLPRRPEGMADKISRANDTLNAESAAAPFKTIAWYGANDAKRKIKATSEGYAKAVKRWLSKPHGWRNNPADSFYLGQEKAKEKGAAAVEKHEAAAGKAKRLLAQAQSAERAARQAEFKDEKLNGQAVAAIGNWRDAKQAEGRVAKRTKVHPYNQIGYLVGLCVAMALFFSVGVKFMREHVGQFLMGFPFVFVIAVLSYMMASQATMKEYGIGYAAWAIVFGLLISNTIRTPRWVKPAVKTEFYIKTGLVLLGAEVLFGKLLAIGLPGVFVAWVVTPLVLITSYLFGMKVLKGMSKTLCITVSAAVSVCGVSAAIATAAACRAKKEELTLAVGMSLVFTSIMMIVMPQLINAVGMDHVLGGAWMGGTIDSTGAVAAAGAFLGDRALHVAATVKMIQNVLIGVVAFCVAVYWCARIDAGASGRVGAIEIWRRFPKFVIGFVLASILCSAIYQALGADVAYVMVDNGVLRGFTKILRGWFFCLAFVSIGLASNFRELRQHFSHGQPVILYVVGQSLNLIVTLGMAYLMFRLVFPDIAAKI
ncbi:MAG: putative sulfate exporter family transporter [Candidatus Brocadiae bacterium]|nr:putative sulfate exporter family transporter [Candidatus Brocadiia bacterium]